MRNWVTSLKHAAQLALFVMRLLLLGGETVRCSRRVCTVPSAFLTDTSSPRGAPNPVPSVFWPKSWKRERLSSVSFLLIKSWSTKLYRTSLLKEYDISVLLFFLPMEMWLANLKNLPLLGREATKPCNIAKFENRHGSKVGTVEGYASLFIFWPTQHCNDFVAERVALTVQRCWGGYIHK